MVARKKCTWIADLKTQETNLNKRPIRRKTVCFTNPTKSKRLRVFGFGGQKKIRKHYEGGANTYRSRGERRYEHKKLGKKGKRKG